jgi:ABC-type histidine transport system ATPase subunit
VALGPEGPGIFADQAACDNPTPGAPASGLSGSQQQMPALWRGLTARPRVLLDEPSRSLAPILVRAISEVMGRPREEGMTCSWWSRWRPRP